VENVSFEVARSANTYTLISETDLF